MLDLLRSALCSAFVLTLPVCAQDVRPHGAMLRSPDVSAERIVFVYADDLWTVSREGGLASPLASPPGLESYPRFSPDGSTIGFTGNYDGNRDLYVVPTEGGIPRRLTHHSASEILTGWTPGGELLYFSRAHDGLGKRSQLYTLPATGGFPTRLPVPYGAFASLNATGEWLAYVPFTRDHRTWKRYRGGMATDIWLFNLRTNESVLMTDWEGTDSLPMWHADTVYYLSDAGPNHRLNLWSFVPATGDRQQLTKFADYDVKWPAIGPGPDGGGEIVFQYGADLMLYDIPGNESRRVDVRIPGARPTLRTQAVDAAEFVSATSVSSTGKRVAVEARGDIWTAPAKHGTPRNLTATSGVAERDPLWSPDGRWIAYLSDATGEYEVMVTQSDGQGEPRRLTSNGSVYRYLASWSPDSKKLLFTDKTGAIFVLDVESGAETFVDRDPWVNSPGGMVLDWSPDSRWIVYERGDQRSTNVSLWLYELDKQKSYQVTDSMFNDENPTFDRDGKYLFFKSNRHFSPEYGELDTSFVYSGSELLLCVPLSAETGSPFAPESDEEEWEEEEDEEDEDEEDDEDEEEEDEDEEPEPTAIEVEGFERRAISLPIDPGNFGLLGVNAKGHLLFVRRGDDGPSIRILDLEDEDREEKTVVEGAGSFELSANGEKILYAVGGKPHIADASADAKGEPLVTAGMRVEIDPRAEWSQLFTDAWRIFRDFFYEPTMHGVDWPAVKAQYEVMLADCATREDVSYVIREMISELNVGHAYYRGGDIESGPSVDVGLLGVDFEVADGAYRIAAIHEGAKWDVDARGPLSQPGVEDLTGKFLRAVNGHALTTDKDPYAWFQGLAGKAVTLTVSDTARGETRELVVEPLRSEADLRYRGWIEANRAYVEERTGGRVGYLYVPDTGVNGQNNLVRQFYGQTAKDALIIDERWNGGGQIPTRFIELLNRPVTNYWARRDGMDWTWPPDAHQGPKCMLINGLAGSGGDAFPAYFRQAGIGKLIGMRTWGGLVGISGNPGLIDGASVNVPTFGYYEADGTWGIEGHGVDPDLVVLDDPALMVDGGDPQLDAAIRHILEELEKEPYRRPQRPKSPDRSGMGIPDTDK